MKSKFLSRKFLLTVFFALGGTGALYIGKMTGGDFIALASLLIAAYGASNVAELHVTSKTQTTTVDS